MEPLVIHSITHSFHPMTTPPLLFQREPHHPVIFYPIVHDWLANVPGAFILGQVLSIANRDTVAKKVKI